MFNEYDNYDEANNEENIIFNLTPQQSNATYSSQGPNHWFNSKVIKLMPLDLDSIVSSASNAMKTFYVNRQFDEMIYYLNESFPNVSVFNFLVPTPQ
jgi:hypothetical protein